jgi:hypothetical protein
LVVRDALDQAGADVVELGQLVQVGGHVVADLDRGQLGSWCARLPGRDRNRRIDAVQRTPILRSITTKRRSVWW